MSKEPLMTLMTSVMPKVSCCPAAVSEQMVKVGARGLSSFLGFFAFVRWFALETMPLLTFLNLARLFIVQRYEDIPIPFL